MASVAQMSSQHEVHPLLRHPRPITRDTAKAQRMLGLIADTEEKLGGLNRQQSKTTRWLERRMYANLEVSDVESEKEEVHEQKQGDLASSKHDYEEDADLLAQWTEPERSTSFSSEYAEPKTKLDTSFNKKRPKPLQSLRPVSYNSQHLLSPEWTASPTTMSPNTQHQRPISLQPGSPNLHRSSFSSISSSGSVHRFQHPQTWPAPAPQHQTTSCPVSDQPPQLDVCTCASPVPIPQYENGLVERPLSLQTPQTEQCKCASPRPIEQRPRPTSFATYQHRDRRNSKIASSRGLRNNSYPNYSRPISEIPKIVPGESIESDAVYNRFTDVEVGPPSPASHLSPISPIRSPLDGFEVISDKGKDEKKPKNRWSTIPTKLKMITMRKLSGSSQEQAKESNIDIFLRLNLTEENLRYAGTTSQPPVRTNISVPGIAPLPTPTYSPVDFKQPVLEAALPVPFAPWADAPPSPALSQEKRRGSELSLSPTRQRRQSRLSVENTTPSRPISMHSRQSSGGMPSPGKQMPPSPMMKQSISPRPVSAIMNQPVSSRPVSSVMNYPVSPRPTSMMNYPASSRPETSSSRKGTPSLERTCIICKSTKEPTAFITRRIAANCWHEPATCYQCLQLHIERCVVQQGWEQCSCPECGERLTYEDMGAFADDENTSIKWEE